MAQTIRLKTNASAGQVPAAGALEKGELGIKQMATAVQSTATATGKLFYGEDLDGDNTEVSRPFGIGIKSSNQWGVPIGGNLEIAAGTGITTTGTNSGDTTTVTIATTADANQNAFTTINPSSGDDAVADSATDTLNFTASGGMTITGTAGTDTINFSSTDNNTQYTAGDGLTLNTLDFDLDASLTTVTTIKNNSLYLGRNDNDNYIDFGTDDKIFFSAAGNEMMVLEDGAMGINSDGLTMDWYAPSGGVILDGTRHYTTSMTNQAAQSGTDRHAMMSTQMVNGKSFQYIWAADVAGDEGDKWMWKIADGGVMTLTNDIASEDAYVTHLTFTPNATVANSSVTFAGDLTVSGGDITLGATGRIQGIDTVSASTDAASKAYVDGVLHSSQNTEFTLTGDSGSNQTIAHGNTLDIAGGTGITTAVGATDTVTVTADANTNAYIAASKLVMPDGSANLLFSDGSGSVSHLGFGTDTDMVMYHDGTDNHIKTAVKLNIEVLAGSLELSTLTSGVAVNIGHTTSETTVKDNLTVTGTTKLSTVANAGTDTDKFLVLDGSGYVDFRTGTEVKSDIGASGEANEDTNLSATANGTSLTIESSTGTNVALPAATTSAWGIMSDDQATKLSNIETSADVTDTSNVTSAGALMDSELTTIALVKGLAKGISDGNVLTANDAVADNDYLQINGTEVEGRTYTQVRSDLGIEAGATADQSAAEIRSLVDAASDSQVFTDNDHTKLDTIESSATADQSAAEIRSLVDAASDSQVFTDNDHTKLNAIEASADVTDTSNVTSAGALMDSELTTIALVKGLAKGISDGNVLTANDAVADNDYLQINGTEVEGRTYTQVRSDLGIEAGATADQSAAEIRSLVDAASDSQVFTDNDHSKLNAIEASADVTDTSNVTSAGALMDSECTNLAAVKAFTGEAAATADQTAAEIKTLLLTTANSVDSDQYVDASIDNAHLADDAVGVAELSATGTASSSTFLRGDNSWTAPTASVADGDKGSITVSSSGSVWTIDNTAVTNAMLANDAVGADELAANAVVTASILDDNVTAAKLANSINTDIATGVTASTTAGNALPKAGGTMSGAIAMGGNNITGGGTFTGALTGNASGSSGSCTGNAATATLASTVTVDNTTTETGCYVALFESASGSLVPKTDGGLRYDADLNKLQLGVAGGYIENTAGTLNIGAAAGYTAYFRGGTTTRFRMGLSTGTSWYFRPTTDDEGYLGDTSAAWKECHAGTFVGNLTGNASGTAATVTGSTQASITSCANLITVGTIGTGTWQGGVIDNDYLDSDTAHLSTTQTFSGAKTFSSKIVADAGIDIDNFNIDAATISLSSGDMILDSAGDIDLQADDGLISFGVSSTGNLATLQKTSAATDFGSGTSFSHGAALHLKSLNTNSGRGSAIILSEKGVAGHVTGFRAPDTLSADALYVLPADVPADDEVLTVTSVSSGLVSLEWAAGGGGGGSGTINSGANRQVAYYSASTTLDGDSGLTFNDGTNALLCGGDITTTGGNITSQTGQVVDAIDTGQVLQGSNDYAQGLSGGTITFASSLSDSRLKHERASYDYGIAELKQLSPEYYKFNKTAYETASSETGLHLPPDNHFDWKWIGLMAQDVEAIMPELVNDVTDTGYKSLNKDALIFTLINAVKELEARIVTLEAA